MKFIHSTVMFRRSIILDEFGGYDETIRYGEDFALWSQVVARYPAALMGQPLVRYRLHAGSKTATQRALGRENRARVVTANVRAVLPDVSCSAEEWELLTVWRDELDSAKLKAYLARMERLSRLYQVQHPEARKSRAFYQTIGWQYGQCARQLLDLGDPAALWPLARGFVRVPLGPALVVGRWFLRSVAHAFPRRPPAP